MTSTTEYSEEVYYLDELSNLYRSLVFLGDYITTCTTDPPEKLLEISQIYYTKCLTRFRELVRRNTDPDKELLFDDLAELLVEVEQKMRAISTEGEKEGIGNCSKDDAKLMDSSGLNSVSKLNTESKMKKNVHSHHGHKMEILNTMVIGAHETLKYSVFHIASIMMDSYRLFKAAKRDYNQSHQAKLDIEVLEREIRELEGGLKGEESAMDPRVRTVLEDALQEYRKCLTTVRAYANVPENSIRAGSGIVGGVTGVTAGGTAGVWAGSHTGALIGASFGPLGLIGGLIAGAVIGGITGGVAGGVVGSATGELVAEKGLQTVVGKKGTDSKMKDVVNAKDTQ